MADILKVTTPMSGYDNSTIKNNPQAGQGPQIQNPVDPSKVMRGDNPDGFRCKSGTAAGISVSFQFRYISQYDKKFTGYFPDIFRYFFPGRRDVNWRCDGGRSSQTDRFFF